MRVLWISLSILCVFIIFSIYFTHSIEKSSNDIMDIIEEVEENVLKEEWKEGSEKISKLKKVWDDTSPPWKTFIDHGELDEIETTMIRIKEYISVNNGDLARTEISILKFLIRQIYTKEKLTIQNVF